MPLQLMPRPKKRKEKERIPTLRKTYSCDFDFLIAFSLRFVFCEFELIATCIDG
jgi:hypothetical protein